MADIYEARWANARRVAKKIQFFLEEGFIVITDQGVRLKPDSLVLTDERFSIRLSPCASLTFFINDKDYDWGLKTPIGG